jgi:hypothetical protein
MVYSMTAIEARKGGMYEFRRFCGVDIRVEGFHVTCDNLNTI